MNPRKAALLLWALDTGERAVKSFLVGWLGAWLAIQDHDLGRLFAGDTLAAGVAAAAGSLVLAAGARQIGSKASASWLPAVLPEIPADVDTRRAIDVQTFDGRTLAARRPATDPAYQQAPRPRRL
jgi:hypothetical protein